MSLNGENMYINKNGDKMFSCNYDGSNNFSEGLAVVFSNYKYGYIDKYGNEIVSCKYKSAGDFSEGMAIVYNEDDKCGYINKNGKEVIPCIYDGVKDGYSTFSDDALKRKFKNGIALMYKNGKWGYINKNGKEIIPCIYNSLKLFSDGVAQFILDEDWGYIDMSGTIICRKKFEWCSDFCDGYALVKYNNKSSIIDKSGREVVPYNYDECDIFSEGLAWVKLDERHGYIDKSGNSTFDYYDTLPELHDVDNWILGAWSLNLDDSYMTLIFKENNIVETKTRGKSSHYNNDYYVNSQNGTYSVEGNTLYMLSDKDEKIQLYIDKDEKVLKIDNLKFIKEDLVGSKTFSPEGIGFEKEQISSNIDGNDAKLAQIEKELKETIDNLAKLEINPSLSVNDIQRIMLYKQNIIRCYDSAIDITNKMGNYELSRKYKIRKEKAIIALKRLPR